MNLFVQIALQRALRCPIMLTTWRTRLTTLTPFLCTIAITSFGLLLWSFLVVRNGVGEAFSDSHTLTFDIPRSDPVAMIIHNTHRYQVTPSAAEEFAALLPSSGHVVYLGSPPRAHTPTLFHEMKCLEIIQAALIDMPEDAAATPTPLVSHCLNYLRQRILCRPNLRLESVTNVNASSEKEYETVCRNWEGVYAAAERNQAAFAALYTA